MPNNRYTFKELDDRYVEPIRTLIADIVYPTKRYLGYRNTAIILLKDGRSVPLLHYLAKLKHGASLDLNKHEPIWTDTNWYNATPDNITLLERVDKSKLTKRAGRPSKLNLGVPYGHPDYQRRYIEATIDKQKEYRRRRYVRKRNAAIEALDNAPTIAPAPDDVVPSDQIDSMQDRLNDILLSTKIANVKEQEVPTPTVPRPSISWNDIAQSSIPSRFSKEFLDGLAAADVAFGSTDSTSSGAKK
jgi:hypothetical protein